MFGSARIIMKKLTIEVLKELLAEFEPCSIIWNVDASPDGIRLRNRNHAVYNSNFDGIGIVIEPF